MKLGVGYKNHCFVTNPQIDEEYCSDKESEKILKMYKESTGILVNKLTKVEIGVKYMKI